MENIKNCFQKNIKNFRIFIHKNRPKNLAEKTSEHAAHLKGVQSICSITLAFPSLLQSKASKI